MSKVPVSFALLHDAVFVGGKNLSERLDPIRHTGLSLIYDEEREELLATWNNETSNIPKTNIRQYTMGEIKDRKAVQITHPQVAGITSAQVETPMSHVHKGQGFGKDGRVKL